MSASIAFSEIETMLKRCAPGATWRMATHSRVVIFDGKTYRSLPKYDLVELGHVRKMIRYLNINRECAGEFLPL